ncbi:MAG: hypothetical protein QXF90_02040 [Thermofilaceae archaeon]
MAGISIKLTREDTDTLARSLEIKHRTSSFSTPSFAVSPSQIDGVVVTERDLRGLIEIPIILRPDALKRMRQDEALQRRFEQRINRKIRRIPADQLVVITPLFEGNYSEDSEIRTYGTYAADLVANPRAGVVATPAFHRSNEKFIVGFTREFLEAITTHGVHVALTIPPFISRETLEKLIELYMSFANENERYLTNLLCVDYNGSNPISRYTFHNFILRFARAIEAETGEPVAILGLNVKYSKLALKYDELPARDLASYFVRLDAYAANHKRIPIPGEVIEKSKKEKKFEERLKILSRNFYAYVSLPRALSEHALSTREKEQLQKLLEDAEEPHDRNLPKRIRSFNAKLIISEALTLQQSLKEGAWGPFESSRNYLESKKSLREDAESIKRINKLTEQFKPKSDKLDSFF